MPKWNLFLHMFDLCAPTTNKDVRPFRPIHQGAQTWLMPSPYDPELRAEIRQRMSPPNRESVADIARSTGVNAQTRSEAGMH